MSFLWKRTARSRGSVEQRREPSLTYSTTSAKREGNIDDVIDIIEQHEFQHDSANHLVAASSSVIQFYPEWCQCFQCITPKQTSSKENENADCFNTIRYCILCPPNGPFARIIEFIALFLVLNLMLWLLFLDVDPENDTPSPGSPGGPIFALFFLELVGLFLGIFMKCIGLPSLLGPLILGIALRNLEPVNLFRNFEGWYTRDCSQNFTKVPQLKNLDHSQCLEIASRLSSNWIKPIRQIALTLILTRAGLELSPKQLRKLKGVVPLLAFGPCIVEAVCCASVTYVFFNVLADEKISIPMCFVTGFALAAVSPAVVVPGMLALKKKGYGVDQGVPTLLIAASSIDDVLAISAYTICLGLAVSGDHHDSIDSSGEWEVYASGPIGFFIGIVHGFIVGSFLHFIPAKHSSGLAMNRLILLLLINMVSLFAYELEEIVAGAGSLAVLVTSFIASFGWRSQRHWKKPMHQLEHYLAHLWTLFVPLLFGTIGREVDFNSPGFSLVRVGKIIGTIMTSLLVRCVFTFFIVSIAKLNYKERLFCALSWIPKATVQAALAPLVLSKIRSLQFTSHEKHATLLSHGEIVVTTAVLAILLTAPIGSVLISLCGPRLLRKTSEYTNAALEREFPDGEGDPEICDSLILLGSVGRRESNRRSSGGDGVRVILRRESENLDGLATASVTTANSNFNGIEGNFF